MSDIPVLMTPQHSGTIHGITVELHNDDDVQIIVRCVTPTTISEVTVELHTSSAVLFRTVGNEQTHARCQPGDMIMDDVLMSTPLSPQESLRLSLHVTAPSGKIYSLHETYRIP